MDLDLDPVEQAMAVLQQQGLSQAPSEQELQEMALQHAHIPDLSQITSDSFGTSTNQESMLNTLQALQDSSMDFSEQPVKSAKPAPRKRARKAKSKESNRTKSNANNINDINNNNNNNNADINNNNNENSPNTSGSEEEDTADHNKKIGRPALPFSDTKKKRHKLKKLDDKIIAIAGGESEKKLILQAYINSSYGEGVFPQVKDSETLEAIGHNVVKLVHELPPTSPLRQPLIGAVGKNIQQAELKRVLKVSESTIKRSKSLPVENSLLYTLKYKPHTKRGKKGGEEVEVDEPPQYIVGSAQEEENDFDELVEEGEEEQGEEDEHIDVDDSEVQEEHGMIPMTRQHSHLQQEQQLHQQQLQEQQFLLGSGLDINTSTNEAGMHTSSSDSSTVVPLQPLLESQ